MNCLYKSNIQFMEMEQHKRGNAEMKLMRETIIERIRNRMAPANAVRVITSLNRARRAGGVDYMVFKEASEMVERYKLEARHAIRAVRRLQLRVAMHDFNRPTLEHEGRLLIANARASIALYRDARRDLNDLLAVAMSGPHRPAIDQMAND